MTEDNSRKCLSIKKSEKTGMAPFFQSLLKGELTVIIKTKEVLHLKAGDSIVEVVNKWQTDYNKKKEKIGVRIPG